MKKSFFTLFFLIAGSSVFAQLPELRPEVVELHRLQQTAIRSNSPADFEAFFRHSLFSERYWGRWFVNYAQALFQNNDLKNAEKYFLKATEIGRLNTVTFSRWFNMIIRRPNEPDRYSIPRTETNLIFFNTVLAKIETIEQNKTPDPRVIAIGEELREMVKRDQDVRRNSGDIRSVDSVNIFRLIELIKENPDIDVLNVNIPGHEGFGTMLLLMHGLVAWESAWTDFFEPFFRRQAEEGRGFTYCFYFDRYRVLVRGEPSFYGEFTRSSGLMRSDFTTREVNIEEINRNRERVGLLPLFPDTSPEQPMIRFTF